MKVLRLLPIGDLEGSLLTALAPCLADIFCVRCEVVPLGLSPEPAYHRERQQYHSSELLVSMQAFVEADCWRVLGVAAVDLYIPILTFVFGEAQVGGKCGLVSVHRLRQDFYGLPRDAELLHQRLLKESVHEIGHTLALTHCENYECAMAPSHAVEWIDVKGNTLCRACHTRVIERLH